MSFRAPVKEYMFLLRHIARLDRIAATDRFAEATPETAEAILSELARLAEAEWAPLQRSGDLDPARLQGGGVRCSEGFAAAYRALAEGGWMGLCAGPAHGGMGLPLVLGTAMNDMLSAACLSLALNPLMTQGQIEALEAHGDADLQARVLPHLIAGDWTGTMNLTEPQAGSDLGALATRAEPAGDGNYRITGSKIFISWADHDFGGNVSHLVLARLPDAPKGSRGISLFWVPKLLEDGSRNALRVVRLEEKMGLHGSPTAEMAYEGALGRLVGAPHSGLAAMFTMMNNARLGVGVQGIGVAEAAWQKAAAWAAGRRQGRGGMGDSGMIRDHADVRRMLGMMRARLFAARAIAFACAGALDLAKAGGLAKAGRAEADHWAARASLLTPIAKAWGTATGMAVAETGMQVHGGMGYIEETGVAQLYRDVRVTAIYEGTNGIQALDLVGRKLSDGGEAALALVEEIQEAAEDARADMPRRAEGLWQAAETLREALEWMLARDLGQRAPGAAALLEAMGLILGGHYHLLAARAEGPEGPRDRLCRVYFTRLLPAHGPLLAEATAGPEDLAALAGPDLDP